MKKIFIILLAFMLIPTTAFCSTTKVLDQDTVLHPQGWVSGGVELKGGTSVTLNEQHEVISGTLKSYTFLRPASIGFFYHYGNTTMSRFMIFKPDTGQIVFNDRGEVISGQIGEDAAFLISGNSMSYLSFKQNTNIKFNEQGYVQSGTLKYDSNLRPLGWRNYLPIDDNAGFLKFKADTEVLFGLGGQVAKGTIANDLRVNGITYPAGTTLQFSESAFPQKS